MDDRSRHGESYVLLRTSDMGLVRDFQLIITQVALRRQLSSVPSDRCAVACRSASAAAHSDSGFYGGINVTFMPFLFTPVVCENLSCADLSCPPPRPAGGGGGAVPSATRQQEGERAGVDLSPPVRAESCATGTTF